MYTCSAARIATVVFRFDPCSSAAHQVADVLVRRHSLGGVGLSVDASYVKCSFVLMSSMYILSTINQLQTTLCLLYQSML